MAREGPCTAWAEAGRDRGVHQVRAQRRGHDDGAGQSVDAAAISFLFELIERSYTSRSTAPCAQHTPAEWHVRLGGGVQAVAMVDRLVRGSVRIDLGDVDARRLFAEGRWRCAPAKRVIRKRRKRRCANRGTSGAYAAK